MKVAASLFLKRSEIRHYRSSSMSDRNPLKARLAFHVLPRNIQHIGADLACYYFEPSQLIVVGISRPSVNPGSVRQNGRLFWLHRLYDVESNMSLRRTSARCFFIFQKDSQNLDGPERLLGHVRQLQEYLCCVVYESKSEGLFYGAVGAHEFLFCGDCRQAATEISRSRRVIRLLN